MSLLLVNIALEDLANGKVTLSPQQAAEFSLWPLILKDIDPPPWDQAPYNDSGHIPRKLPGGSPLGLWQQPLIPKACLPVLP